MNGSIISAYLSTEWQKNCIEKQKATIELLFYMNRHKKKLRNIMKRERMRKKFVATHIMSIVNKKRRIERRERKLGQNWMGCGIVYILFLA